MVLFIGGHEIDGSEDLGRPMIGKRILALPLAKVYHRSEKPPVPESKMWLCHEREILAASNAELNQHGIAYLGTKRLRSCIAAYITTESGRAFIHINANTDFGFERIIQKLKPLKEMRITLAGGRYDPDSSLTLCNFVRSLYGIAQRFKIAIHIDQQFVIDNNKATPQSKDEFFFDRFFVTAERAYQNRFNEKLPDRCRLEYTVNNFGDNKIPAVSDAELGIFFEWLKSAQTVQDKPIVDAIKPKVEQMLFPQSTSDNIVDQKKRFFELMRAMSSNQGKALLAGYYDAFSIRLENFVFAIDTGEIFSIPLCTPMPREAYRALGTVAHDFISKPYQLITLPPQPLPVLSETFLNKCEEIAPQVRAVVFEDRTLARTQIFQFFNGRMDSSPNIFIDYLCEFIQSPSDYQLARLARFSGEREKFGHSAVDDFRNNRHRQAIEKYQLLIEAVAMINDSCSKNCATYYSNAASSYRDLGLWKEAVFAMDKAISIFDKLKNAEAAEKALNKKADIIQKSGLPAQPEEVELIASQYLPSLKI